MESLQKSERDVNKLTFREKYPILFECDFILGKGSEKREFSSGRIIQTEGFEGETK
jgi:hypothetical protein